MLRETRARRGANRGVCKGSCKEPVAPKSERMLQQQMLQQPLHGGTVLDVKDESAHERQPVASADNIVVCSFELKHATLWPRHSTAACRNLSPGLEAVTS